MADSGSVTHGDPNVIGRSLDLNGTVYRIVGVIGDDMIVRDVRRVLVVTVGVVRVRVALSDPDGTLRSGMTGNAKVDGGWHMAIVVFSRALLRFVLVELWSWVP